MKRWVPGQIGHRLIEYPRYNFYHYALQAILQMNAIAVQVTLVIALLFRYPGGHSCLKQVLAVELG